LAESLGETRDAAVCRELTKKFEEVRRGSLGDLARAAGTLPERGEYVVLIDRPRARAGMAATAAEGTDLDAALTAALGRLPPTAAAAEVARSFGLSRRTVYARALALRAASGGQG
jgi:16S rRNA (cytidine1402-2'-O)-methyltransferase